MSHYPHVVNALVITGPYRSDWREQPVGTDLQSLQGLVGGYIEILHRKEYTVAINEDGLSERLTPTVASTAGVLVGPVVVFGPRDGSALTALGPAARAAFERDYLPFSRTWAWTLAPVVGQACSER